ncbi:MAG: hypothetical protein NC402_01070 [Prevotella sp.]|nr:hypothetical protein [Prevotella sp.]MCM1075475.1 hypothetical protein [Ruminococcus sp.]
MKNKEMLMSGVFWAALTRLSGHNARIAPYKTSQISSKIHRPDIHIFY